MGQSGFEPELAALEAATLPDYATAPYSIKTRILLYKSFYLHFWSVEKRKLNKLKTT